MGRTDIVILENNQSIVDIITSHISKLMDNMQIFNCAKNTRLDAFNINDTLFIATDKEMLLSQLYNLCGREEVAVFSKHPHDTKNCQCVYCAGKVHTMYGFFKNNTGKMFDDEYQTDCFIDKVFSVLGIRRNLLGATYLNYAIKLAVSNPLWVMQGITTRLYPNIAKNYDTTPSKVERSIRHTLESCYTYGKFTSLNTLFEAPIYTELDKPSNGEFIALMADKITLKLQNTKYISNGI